MSQENDEHNQYPRNSNPNFAPTFSTLPGPTYAQPVVQSQGSNLPATPYVTYTESYADFQPRGYIEHRPNDLPNPTKPGCLVYSCGGICGFTILFFFIVGIMVAIPWLGLFVIVSLVPGLFILWFLYWRKHRNDAELTRVVKFITIGMLGVIPVAFVELLVSTGFVAIEVKMVHAGVPSLGLVFFSSFVSAFLVASLCEESFKMMLAYYATVQHGRDVPNTVLIYSMAGALGLATLENMMYIIKVGLSGSFALTVFTAITRAFMAVPLHATTGILIGADVAHNRFTPTQKPWYKVFIVPFLLHGIYDFCTMFASTYVTANEGQYWIFFMPVFSLITVIIGIWYARKRRQAVINLPVNSYSVLNSNTFAV